MKVALTVDVEEWFHSEYFKENHPFSKWGSLESRVEIGLNKILEMLEEYNVKATFFVLGWVAERKPHLVKLISDNHHEVASHGYSHELNYLLSKEDLLKEIDYSKKLLEDISGQEVAGYRASNFSISYEVIEILKSSGYKYDSSLNGASIKRYGKLHNIKVKYPYFTIGEIYEFPMPVLNLFFLKLPVSGGGYFRLLPYSIFEKAVKAHLKKYGFYLFYLHPWELDPKQPKVKNIKWSYKFRHYYGINRVHRKLETLLSYLSSENVRFVTLKDYYINNIAGAINR